MHAVIIFVIVDSGRRGRFLNVSERLQSLPEPNTVVIATGLVVVGDLIGSGEAGRKVWGLSDDAVLLSLLRSDEITNNHQPGRDTDAGL